MSTLHSVRFPGESAEYRRARDELLEAEIATRRQQSRLAELRSRLPLGGPLKEDYVFEEGAADLDDVVTLRHVRLSELFTSGKDTLILYSFMFGPDMPAPCPMCSSMLDGLNGNAMHAMQRVNLAVVAKSPIQRIRAFARERPWRRLRLLSSAQNRYNADYHGETDDGEQIPALNVFVRRGGQIHHFYNTELLFAPADGRQDPRHVDTIWPLWNVLDLTPEGRGADWYPKLNYEQVA